jgi:hypothetical protein
VHFEVSDSILLRLEELHLVAASNGHKLDIEDLVEDEGQVVVVFCEFPSIDFRLLVSVEVKLVHVMHAVVFKVQPFRVVQEVLELDDAGEVLGANCFVVAVEVRMNVNQNACEDLELRVGDGNDFHNCVVTEEVVVVYLFYYIEWLLLEVHLLHRARRQPKLYEVLCSKVFRHQVVQPVLVRGIVGSFQVGGGHFGLGHIFNVFAQLL